jgi:hypothetical protein
VLQLEQEMAALFDKEAGAYTRQLLSSTLAVFVSESFYVQFLTSYDP